MSKTYSSAVGPFVKSSDTKPKPNGIRNISGMKSVSGMKVVKK